MGRYFDEMQAVIERHGGTVEKFIGDAVMAVFGIPVAPRGRRAPRGPGRGRDARAARRPERRARARLGGPDRRRAPASTRARWSPATPAAAAIRDRRRRQRRRASRAGAPPGEILIGDPTYRLVARRGRGRAGRAARAQGQERAGRRLPPRSIGGPARRVAPAASTRRWSGASASSPLLDAGVRPRGRGARVPPLHRPRRGRGREVAARRRSSSPGSATGRPCCAGAACPTARGSPSGRWPRSFATAATATSPTRAKPDAPRRRRERELIADRLGAALGLGGALGAPEETVLGRPPPVRGAGAERPLVVVFDDLHWAEPTFLDLVEHLADWSRDAPILLLCLARPELLDERPGWGGGKLNATSVLLEPLTDDESAELIENLLGRRTARPRDPGANHGRGRGKSAVRRGDARDAHRRRPARPRRTATGSPTGDLVAITVPPTIQALLAARLDRLGRASGR